jgi:O-antigen/teichoic acid export membrane protein
MFVAQLFSAPLWPAFAEALQRGDREWARNAFRRAMKLFSGFGLVSAVAMGLGSYWIVDIWVGPDMVPTTLMAAGFAFWVFINNFFAAISSLMASKALVKKLVWLTTFAASISFAVKIVLVKNLGPPGVVWGSVLGYGSICFPGILLAQHVLRRKG